MFITSSMTGQTYNLAIENEFYMLQQDIVRMRDQGRYDELRYLYDQVAQYYNYTGPDSLACNARAIAAFLVSIQNTPAAPVSYVATSAPVAATSTEHRVVAPAIQRDASWIISMAPLNSSGDIYHILAFLILLQASNRTLPTVQLNYDIDLNPNATHSSLTVGNQVKRSVDFAATLGLAGYFRTEKLAIVSARENSRQKTLKQHFLERSATESITYMDQMATTAWVSRYVLEYGFEPVTSVLRKGFSKRDNNAFPLAVQQVIDGYVAGSMGQIDTLRRGDAQPLIVLHIRHSSTANSHLNLPDVFINQLAAFLYRSGYQVCFVLADDRRTRAHYMLGHQPDTAVMLEPFKERGFVINAVDYAKQGHLQLLQAFKRHPRTLGVIGNTSGTLDIAAMLGLATYCIHQFTVTRLSYQECRLYFQLAFMSLGALVSHGTHYDDSGLWPWLTKPEPRKGIALFDHLPGQKPFAERVAGEKLKSGFNKMFFCTFFERREKRAIEIPEASQVIERLSSAVGL